jgi:hypothetical protein
MKKQRFHSHNAYTLPITDADGIIFAEVFFSYYTPIGVNVSGKFITSKHKYSSSTTRQTNRYVKEENLTLDVMDNLSFFMIIKELGNKHNFDLGRLR